MLIVGRDAELQSLRTLVSAAESGAGGAALVEGEAGLGKTRLLEHLADGASGTVVWGRAWEEPGAPPYWSWRQALASLGDVDWDELGSAPAVATAVLDVLRGAARAQPLLVLLDDLHAGDDDSRRLAAFVARSIREVPVALVMAARPTPAMLVIARVALDLRLRPLDAAATDELIVATSPVPLDDAHRGSILATGEGNPLVTIELARLAGRTERLPRELHAIVQERLRPLSPMARGALEGAAVLGRTFAVDRLMAMEGMTSRDLLVLLEPAVALDLVVPVDHRAWRFTHQILRDGVYDGLTPVRRLELHAQAAAAIAEVDPRSVGELANHLARAVPLVDRADALAAMLEAARRARAAGASGDEADTYARALELVDADVERLDVLLALGRAAVDAGQITRAHDAYDQAIAMSRVLDAAEGFARATLGRTERLRSDTFSQRWLPTIEAARHGLGSVPSALGCRLQARSALILAESGGPGCLDRAEDAVAQARLVDDPAALAECLVVLHFSSCVPDLVDRAREVADELVRVATRIGDADRLLEAAVAQLTTALTVGDMTAADEALARCETVAATSGDPRHRFFALSRRATRAFLAGQLAEGDDLLRQAFELGTRIEEPDTEAVFHAARMVVLPDLLDPADIVTEIEAAMGDRVDPVVAFYRAYVAAITGDVESARVALGEAFTFFDVPSLVHQVGWPYWACRVAEVVAVLGDRERASLLYDALSPHGHLFAINAGAVAFGGVVDHYVALLCVVLDRNDEARERLRRARDSYRRIGAVRFVGHVEQALERVEATGGGSGDGATPELSIERAAGGWVLTLGDHVATLSDSRGLQHLARLRAAAGQDLHVLDLVAGQAGAARFDTDSRQPVLDDEAKAAYRERVADLQDEIAEAEAHHDIERAALLRVDLDALLEHLRQAAGLGGRTRAIPTDTERARVAVRKAIVNAIDRVARRDPRLGQHLRDHVRTGVLCRYEPASPA